MGVYPLFVSIGGEASTHGCYLVKKMLKKMKEEEEREEEEKEEI